MTPAEQSKQTLLNNIEHLYEDGRILRREADWLKLYAIQAIVDAVTEATKSLIAYSGMERRVSDRPYEGPDRRKQEAAFGEALTGKVNNMIHLVDRVRAQQ